jgi:hypothetical protein
MAAQVAPTRQWAGDNPFGVDPQADLLSEPRNEVPNWSETMYFGAWSPADEVGIWTHMGVVPEDSSMWWAQVFALLPDGVVLVDRSFGRPASNRGPQTGNLKIECVEPGQRWRLRFDGAGEISSTDALAAGGTVGAGIATPFFFDLEFDAVVPVYDIHAAMRSELDWNVGTIHHEQGFAITGTLKALGKTWSMSGSGIRDHSVGPRDFGAYGDQGHIWNYIVWPEQRRALGAFLRWRPTTKEVTTSIYMITENGHTEVGSDVRMTLRVKVS